MASSLATHQFAGVNAQLKCVPRPLSDANTGSTPLPRGRAARREIRDDTTAAGTARPGATRRSRRFRRSRTDIHPPRRDYRSAAARKNVKAARNVQVRPE